MYVVTRSQERTVELQHEGYHPIVADVTLPKTLHDLPDVETILFSVGFDRSVGNSITEVYAEGLKNVLAALPSTVKQFIYISTTGVYGPEDGAWVDETTPTNPQREGGKASLAAESLLGENSIILRLAGIYGPGRIPYLEKLRAGEPIAAPSKGWLNLIHVDDAAATVLAAEAFANSQTDTCPHTFCVSDGQPVVRGEYYQEVARQIGASAPTFIAPNPNSPAAARASADKRINNSRLIKLLGVRLAYPSYRDGLAAIFS